MPARVKKIRHDDETRSKIQAAQIINRFHACLMGEIVLDAQQVSVGKTLLAKVLPDLSTTTIKGDIDNPLVMVEQNAERFASGIARIATRSRPAQSDKRTVN